MCFRPPFVSERTSYDHPAGLEVVMPATGILRAKRIVTPPRKDVSSASLPSERSVEIEVDGKVLRVLVGRFGGDVVEGETYISGTVVGYVGAHGVWVEPVLVAPVETVPVGA